MPNEAATDWICPGFTAVGRWTALVNVLNPNADRAEVTATFHDQWGVKVEEETKIAAPSEVVWFTPDEFGLMWVRIRSDRPVLPDGSAPAALYSPQNERQVSMHFYQAEGTKVTEIVRVPIDRLREQ